jgi:hypothetical protein
LHAEEEILPGSNLYHARSVDRLEIAIAVKHILYIVEARHENRPGVVVGDNELRLERQSR